MADTNFPELVTARLHLRLPEPAEAASVLAYYVRNREHLAPWDPDRSPEFYSERFWAAQLAARRREFAAGTSAAFTLHAADDPSRTIGSASLTNIVGGVFQACHLGFSIDAACEGRGLMREALEGLLAFAFDDLGLHRVMAAYQPENERSAALLRRLDFVREGLAREYLFLGGAWRDHVLTARVRKD